MNWICRRANCGYSARRWFDITACAQSRRIWGYSPRAAGIASAQRPCDRYVLGDFSKTDSDWVDSFLGAICAHADPGVVARMPHFKTGFTRLWYLSHNSPTAKGTANGFQMRYCGSAECHNHLVQCADKTAAAQAANFPFCTIEPNIVTLPCSTRALMRWQILQAPSMVPRLSFVDIAGLARGASSTSALQPVSRQYSRS